MSNKVAFILLDGTNLFWVNHYDFWIFIILAIGGIIISAFGLRYAIKAFKEAEQAKNAANQAGIVVKTQEIIMELERISNVCQFEEEVRFSEATNKLNEISARIYVILGLYRSDQDIKEQSQLIQENISSVKTALETANPSNPENPVNDPELSENITKNYVYNITSPHLTNLINSINTLKGILNSRLIKIN